MKFDLRTSSKVLVSVAVLASSLAVTGCNKNNNAGGITTPEAFVNKLVEMGKNGVVSSSYDKSTLAKVQANQPGYFVIWDSNDQKYMAINLNTYNQGTLTQAIEAFVQQDEANPANAGVLVTPDGNDANGNPLYVSGNGVVYKVGSQTRDVDLQRAQLQTSQMLQTAASISRNFQMSFDSAVQITELADRMNALSARGGVTDQDRQAETASLAGIAGLTQQELNAALTAGAQGNTTVVNATIDKAAKNLGMPSSSVLRDQILPAMGLGTN